MFDKPKPPTPPPPPPMIDEAKQESERADLLRQRRGRAATFVSDPTGRSTGGAATRTLLGQ